MSITFADNPTLSRASLENPSGLAVFSTAAARHIFSPELIESLSLSSFLSWKERNIALGKDHPDHHRSFHEIEQQNGGFLEQLTVGRLTYFSNFITREGLAAMIALGERGESLEGLDSFCETPGYRSVESDNSTGSPETIHATLARLDHENWLNVVSSREQYRSNGGEWEKLPAAQKALNFEGVDRQARGIALLCDDHRQRLLDLSQPGDGNAFFHHGISLSVRSSEPVFAANAGADFHADYSPQEFLIVCREIAHGSARFYRSHALFDRLGIPSAERQLIQRLLFTTEGSPLPPAQRRESLDAFSQACRLTDRAGLDELVARAEDLLDRANRTTPEETKHQLKISLSPAHPSFREAFPRCAYQSGGVLVDFQAGWLAHYLPKYAELSDGFSPRPENLARSEFAQPVSAKPRGATTLREQHAIEVLALLQGYPTSAVRHLHAIGSAMFDQGVLGFREQPFSSLEGMHLRTGGTAKIDETLAHSLCYGVRRIMLDLSRDPQFAPDMTDRPWKSEKPRIKRLFSDRPDASWESDHRTLYALALAIGTLQENDYTYLRSVCSIQPAQP